MTDEMFDLVALLKSRDRLSVKRYEMSKATLRIIEKQLGDQLIPWKPHEQRSLSLWGIPIHFDNELPDGEIKPIYA